jgi:hypothetical protein
MNELYDSVQHRLDISYKLVSDTIQERRNEIIKVATFIGLVFASVAVVEFLVNNLLLNYVYNQQWWWLASIKAFIGGNWKGVFNMFVWAVLLLLGIFFWWKAK